MARSISNAAALLLVISIATTAFCGDTLRVGDRSPDFSLPYATQDTLVDALKLSDVVGKNNIILAFYPADWSGGCTKEMCTMRDNFGILSDLGAKIYGISGDYVNSHREWARHLNLQFALFSDHDHSIAKLYSSYNSETGKNFRTVYVIGRNGNIAYIDLAYKAGTQDSFEKLKSALAKLK